MKQPTRPRLQVESLEAREVPSTSPVSQTFETTTSQALPGGWTQWSNDGSTVFAAETGQGVGGSIGVVSSGGSRTAGLAWQTNAVPGDTSVSAAVQLSSLVPTFVFTRGTNLATTTPSYVAAAIARGATVSVVQMSNGTPTVLATLTSPTPSYFSGNWVQTSLILNGSSVSVQVVREDTGQYLNAQGNWQAAATNAIVATTTLADVAGDVGIGRMAAYSGAVDLDNFTYVPPPAPPPPPPTTALVAQSFDTTPVGATPAGWQSWASDNVGTLGVTSAVALGSTNGYASNGGSTTAARAWSTTPLPAAVTASAAVDLTSLIPAELFVDGANLNTSSPTYDALTVTRGLQASLLQVVNGTTTTLASLQSTSYFSGQWVQVEITAQASSLLATVYRTDTKQWLTSAGGWSSTPTYAFDVQNAAVLPNGDAGIGREARYAGTLVFDNFTAGAVGTVGPVVGITSSTGSTPADGSITFHASGNGIVSPVVFALNGQVQAASAPAPANWTLNTAALPSGNYTLTVLAGGADGTVGTGTYAFTVANSATSPPPVSPPAALSPPFPVPQLNPNVRIAELAYAGTPIGMTETQLLQNNVDLVVANPQIMPAINAIAPKTPQLIYSNVSNLYQGLLLNWMNYASANGLNPEDAFYHVTQPTPFSGSSASSQPVNWFWGVFQTTPYGTLSNFTSTAHNTTGNGFGLGGAGQWTAVGYPDKFAEVDLAVKQPAAAGWAGVWQYATATDTSGNPTAWQGLQINTSGTTQATTITFDPPSNWVPATVQPGGERLYYVRFVVTSGTAAQAPILQTLLGADYTNSAGSSSGVIPVFDYAADKNHDGYLNAAEWANRTPGDNARFAYQSRLFYPYYGPMRFVTDPSAADFRAWAGTSATQLLADNPLADGIFLDNESGKLPFTGTSVVESTANYSSDSGALVAAVTRAVGPNKLVMVNASGGGSESGAVAAAAGAVFEESLLRPLASTWSEVGDVTGLVDGLLAAPRNPYVVIDSLPTGGSPTDPRTQLATLAYYDLVARPQQTMLMFYGGYSPATSWTQHWAAAAAVNVGQPTGSMQVIATGTDPENPALTYKVFSRTFSNGLVLYKPLSYAVGVGTGTLDSATATMVPLNGQYQQVNADGTLGPVITSISLMNGQGAVLVKA